MWTLSIRDDGEGRQWSELGTFSNISDAARCILKKEGDPLGALFFRIYVDPPLTESDAQALSRLEYQGAKAFYLLTRQAH